MTDVQRDPVLVVNVDGRLLPNVTGARVTRGFEQEMTTAQITLAGSAPAWVKQGSQVVIRMGGTIPTAYQRFFGYVGNLSSKLWSPSGTLDCGDVLLYAKYFKPSSEIDLSGMTDEQIITTVFQTMGVPDVLLTGISGTGKIFGDDPETALVWPRQETALGVIQEVDGASLGFRTWVDPGGAVKRTEITELPTADAAYTFTEGVDILSGSSSFELPDPNNEVSVLGNGVESTVDDGGANTLAWHSNPVAVTFPMLQQQATSATQLSTQEVAEWLLEHLNRNLVTVNFVTHRDELLVPDMTILTNAPHLRNYNLFWLQNVVSEISPGGATFRQQVQLVSERSLGTLGDLEDGPPDVVDPFTGDPLPLPVPPILVPGTEVAVSFSIAPIDKEVVLIAAVETTLYTVQATDTTAPLSGTVASRAWSAAGPGATVTSGTEETFTVGFTDLTGASITLEVTDSLSNVGTLTRELDGGGGAPIKVKKLYAATASDWEVFDGAVWRTDTPGGDMLAIAPGPVASADLSALRTDDDLATPATSTAPFTTSNVTAIWVEEDVNTTDVVAGAADGRVAVSTDGGLTWALKDGPGGEVRRIIASRFTPGEIHLICDSPANGYYTSDNSGDDWTLQRAGDFVELVLAPSRNAVVTAAGELQRAEAPGEDFTFPGTPTIVAAAPHIRRDIFYAWGDDGTAYATEASGGWTMEAREPIPDSGTPHVRSGDNDGEMVDLVYIAATSGAWKSLDGLRTADGYLKLRDGDHILIKHGIFTDAPAAAVSTRLYVVGDSGAIYKSADSGATWANLTGTGLTGAEYRMAVEGRSGGNDIVYLANDSGLAVSMDGGATWAPGTTPPGGVGILEVGPNTHVYNGSYESDDNAASWTAIPASGFMETATAAKLWSGYDAANISRMNLDGTSQEVIPLAVTWISGPHCFGQSDTMALMVGGDADSTVAVEKVVGTTATDITPPTAITYGFMYAASNDGGTTILAATYEQNTINPHLGELWRSADSGASWTRVINDANFIPSFGNRGPHIVYDPNSTSSWYALGGSILDASVDAVVWRSSDNGVTWTSAVLAVGEFEFNLIRATSG